MEAKYPGSVSIMPGLSPVLRADRISEIASSAISMLGRLSVALTASRGKRTSSGWVESTRTAMFALQPQLRVRPRSLSAGLVVGATDSCPYLTGCSVPACQPANMSTT